MKYEITIIIKGNTAESTQNGRDQISKIFNKHNVKIVENTPIDNRFSKNLFEIKIPIKYVRKVI